VGTYKQKGILISLILIVVLIFAGCSGNTATEPVTEEVESNETGEVTEETAASQGVDDGNPGEIEITIEDEPEEEEPSVDIELTEPVGTEEEAQNSDPKDVDLIFFMGQSNMSGCGGDYTQAPAVVSGAGYEFRAVTDPFNLHEIQEPFGLNESIVGGIWDVPGAKRGSLVSAFVNKYYEQTHRTVVAVSASAGGTSTEDWLTPSFVTDISVRVSNAQNYLRDNGYTVKNQYVVWLQGESDALDGMTYDGYKTNMDNIIRPLFIAGFTKVFIITPGQVKNRPNFFNNIIDSQINMCKTSGYYALASTALCAVDQSYMVDEWHYSQKVLNLIGSEAAEAVAYYTNNRKEMCVYDYKHGTTIIPDFFDYADDITVPSKDINGILAQQ